MFTTIKSILYFTGLSVLGLCSFVVNAQETSASLRNELTSLLTDIKEDVAFDEKITSMIIDGHVYALAQSATEPSDGFLPYRYGNNTFSMNYSEKGLTGEVFIDGREFTITPKGIVELPKDKVDPSVMSPDYDPSVTVASQLAGNTDSHNALFEKKACCDFPALNVLKDLNPKQKTAQTDNEQVNQQYIVNTQTFNVNDVRAPGILLLILLSIIATFWVKSRLSKK